MVGVLSVIVVTLVVRDSCFVECIQERYSGMRSLDVSAAGVVRTRWTLVIG